MKRKNLFLTIMLAMVLCLSMLPLASMTVSADDITTQPIFTRYTGKSESLPDSFEAVLYNGSLVIDPTANNCVYYGYDTGGLLTESKGVEDKYVLVFDRDGNDDEYFIKRKSDGKYLYLKDKVCKWESNDKTKFTMDLTDDRYRIYEQGTILKYNLWINDNQLSYSTDRYNNFKFYIKSAYQITYTYGSEYTQIQGSKDYAFIDEGGVFIPQDISLGVYEITGKKLGLWKDGEGNLYAPGYEYYINKSLVLTPVWHTHNHKKTTINPNGNNIGYTQHVCECGDFYIDEIKQETSVEKVEHQSGELKFTYTDGNTFSLSVASGQDVENLKNKIVELENADDTLDAAILALKVALADATAQLQKKIDDNKASAEALAADIEALTNAYKAADALLNNKIDTDTNALKQDFENKLAESEKSLQIAVNTVQKNLDSAVDDVSKALADGDALLDKKLKALDEAYRAADVVINSNITKLNTTDEALQSSIETLKETLMAADRSLKADLTATKAELNSVNNTQWILITVIGILTLSNTAMIVIHLIKSRKVVR